MAEIYGIHPRQLGSRVCVELPDMEWARQYRDWQVAHHGDDVDCIDVMLVPLSDFRDEANATVQNQLATESVRCIWSTGRPAPLCSRIFHIEGGRDPNTRMDQ